MENGFRLGHSKHISDWIKDTGLMLTSEQFDELQESKLWFGGQSDFLKSNL
ncbi:hypothetical protein SSCH_1630003 [Syntrophaceticus schinkii]|uniref:Uncharacterized protein n=1 Tax=Syntrophaceticus schinkii TaxID=499207 RepID=A0A0B7MJ94_9FIRM|nr:hypothetical protein SSCH_1630003 [Syntrophaceticus schinkii]